MVLLAHIGRAGHEGQVIRLRELTLILYLASCSTSAQDVSGSWVADADGCRFLVPRGEAPPQQIRWDGSCLGGYVNGPGALTFGTITYRGEFKQGTMPEGELILDATSSYRGAFKDNRPHGRGSWKRDDGIVVEGEFADSRPVGVVHITSPGGGVYHGEVKFYPPGDQGFSWHFRAEGKGELIQPGDTHYIGDFQDNLYHGQGKAVASNGYTYTGGFAHGKSHGTGVGEWANGTRYEGEFVSGYRQGQGTLKYADGGVYVGEFLADERQGKGRMEFPNGITYEGDWKADSLNGQCSVSYADGGTYVGQCVDGKRSGQGRVENPLTGLTYEGGYLNDRFHGHGRLTQAGYAYEGGFVSGTRSGNGKEVFESGEQYQGEFARDLRNGHGILRLPLPGGDELTYDGSFKDGLMHGDGTMVVGQSTFEGEFKQGIFIRGLMRPEGNRVIEVDVEERSYMEVLPNGTRVPLNEADLWTPDT